MSKVFELLEKERSRQNHTIELIASENFVSENILKALGSEFTNKYTEGYPPYRGKNGGKAGRYYGGCKYYDELENYCCDEWRKVFKTNYHVNVQPHSGSQANMAAYAAVLKPGDTILAMSLDAGGHLTHSSPVSFVSKLYNIVTYGIDENGNLRYDEIFEKIEKYKPMLILVGASSYPRIIDYSLIYEIIKEFRTNYNYDPIFMVDMAHVAGLIAAGEHPSPFGYADIITTTTHKTLRGPRGGLIFCKPELAEMVDAAVFPRTQGGSLMNVVAAKAICAEEAQTAEFKKYAKQVVRNAKAMAARFKELNIPLITGGTDNHMLLLDLRNLSINGKELQDYLEDVGITVNKNAIPNDPLPPNKTSGIRIGTSAMTTKGYTEEDFIYLAERIAKVINTLQGG